MRAIIFHRRAARYLSRMPRDRAVQVRDALRAVAECATITDHPHIRSMSVGMAGWFRLRVGSYRVILQVTVMGNRRSALCGRHRTAWGHLQYLKTTSESESLIASGYLPPAISALLRL